MRTNKCFDRIRKINKKNNFQLRHELCTIKKKVSIKKNNVFISLRTCYQISKDLKVASHLVAAVVSHWQVLMSPFSLFGRLVDDLGFGGSPLGVRWQRLDMKSLDCFLRVSTLFRGLGSRYKNSLKDKRAVLAS